MPARSYTGRMEPRKPVMPSSSGTVVGSGVIFLSTKSPATSVILSECALCLALDGERLAPRAGVLTPATGMGAIVADRLRAAGQTFDVSRVS